MAEKSTSTGNKPTSVPATMAEPAKVRKKRMPKDIPVDETKAQKFMRLWPERWAKFESRVKSIANLAGPTYEYTEEQKAIVLAKIRKELNKVEVAFNGTKVAASNPWAV